MLYLILMRGLPGSGKSTMARRIAKARRAIICSTDDFWIEKDGQYRFNPEFLQEAHKWNLERTQKALIKGQSVIVDNCNHRLLHMEPYLKIAKRYKAKINIILAPLNDEQTDFLHYNTMHNIPLEAIQKMRKEWEHLTPEFLAEFLAS
jgi:predicted kinase